MSKISHRWAINPFDNGRYVSPSIPDTGAISAVAVLSTLCKHDETVLKPWSLGLIRTKPPSQCGGIGGPTTVLGALLTPLSLTVGNRVTNSACCT